MTGLRLAFFKVSLLVALVACLAFAGLTVAKNGSLGTIDLCITKSGPDKGSIRFVQPKLNCKVGEQHVPVVRGSDQQGYLGIQGGSGETRLQGPPGKEGPRGPAGATAYTRVEATSSNGSGGAGDPETASVTVTCQGGRRVIGGGAQVNAGPVSATNNPGEVMVTQDRPTSDTAWTVAAVTDDKEDVGAWTVTAYAICASMAS